WALRRFGNVPPHHTSFGARCTQLGKHRPRLFIRRPPSVQYQMSGAPLDHPASHFQPQSAQSARDQIGSAGVQGGRDDRLAARYVTSKSWHEPALTSKGDLILVVGVEEVGHQLLQAHLGILEVQVHTTTGQFWMFLGEYGSHSPQRRLPDGAIEIAFYKLTAARHQPQPR